jgi:four helix bundle protein
MSVSSYKGLVVWQKAIDLVTDIYKLTRNYPPEELYGLVSQMRRAAVSIPSNIAEGSRRTGSDRLRFFRIAYGSGAELETQIEISKKLEFTDNSTIEKTEKLLEEILKMLNVMLRT